MQNININSQPCKVCLYTFVKTNKYDVSEVILKNDCVPWNQNPAASPGHILHSIFHRTVCPLRSISTGHLAPLSSHEELELVQFLNIYFSEVEATGKPVSSDRTSQIQNTMRIIWAYSKFTSLDLLQIHIYSELQHFKASLASSQCEGCSKR